ncbi:MAG: CBS domain-containing protein [Simkaniaceae bacterium]|nr:CBS domain-containing protein [Simkaniaceae bacterium]
MFFVTRTSGVQDRLSKENSWKIDANKRSKPDKDEEENQKYKVLKDAKKKKKTALIAKEIMNKSDITLPPEMSLEDAKKLIAGKSVWHIPVLSREGILMGLITDRELHAANNSKEKKTVRDIMATTVLCASPEAEVKSIAEVFFEQKIGAIPIVDSNSKFMGILTPSDVLRTIVKITSLDI